MAKIKAARKPSLTDRQTVREVFYAISLIERGKPVLAEMVWCFGGCLNVAAHEKILPDYCYNIFEAFRRTLFKGMPQLIDTMQVIDPAGLASAKTIADAKKGLRFDWKKLGKMTGILTRCVRFADLESADEFKRDNVGESSPEKTEELFAIIFGRQWVSENLALIRNEPEEQIFSRMLNQHLASLVAPLQSVQTNFDVLAYQWSPVAMADFNEGFTEGLTCFIDVEGQFAGESSRTGIYGFLLLMWPEIKVLLASHPKKTLSDLHEWLQPFMRRDVITTIDIETLRDVCAPPPSGIGLSLRPLKVRSPK